MRRPGTSLSSVLMLPREVEACVSCEVQQSGGAAPTYPVCVWKVGQLAQAAAGVEELTPLFTSPVRLSFPASLVLLSRKACAGMAGAT